MVHIAGVTGVNLNLMVVLDDWGEKIREGLIRVRRSSVHTNARVSVLATRQDALFEGDTEGVFLVVILVPYALGEDLTELTVTFVVLELRETLQVVDVL